MIRLDKSVWDPGISSSKCVHPCVPPCLPIIFGANTDHNSRENLSDPPFENLTPLSQFFEWVTTGFRLWSDVILLLSPTYISSPCTPHTSIYPSRGNQIKACGRHDAGIGYTCYQSTLLLICIAQTRREKQVSHSSTTNVDNMPVLT